MPWKSVTYRSLTFALPPDLALDVLPDGQLDGPLTDLGQVGAGKSFGDASQVVEVDLAGDRSLPQVGPKDGAATRLVRKGNVDQLIETARAKDGRIDDVGSEINEIRLIPTLSIETGDFDFHCVRCWSSSENNPTRFVSNFLNH